jgi:hypothetical protein
MSAGRGATMAAPLVTISLSGHPLSPNARRRAHWAAVSRDTAMYRDGVAWQTRAAYHGPPLQRAGVHVRIVHRGPQRYDPDGAVGVAKSLVDGLTVRAGGTVLVDDKDIELVVTQERGPKRGVELAVWPLPEPGASAAGASLDSTVATEQRQSG